MLNNKNESQVTDRIVTELIVGRWPCEEKF